MFRDADVVVTSWSAARIPWPRCRALGRRGGSGLLVNEELARGESSLAIQHWWGVTGGVVWRWKKAHGVGMWETEGSRRLLHENSRAGAEAIQAHEFSDAERKKRRRSAKRLNLVQHITPGYPGPLWTPEQLALLGTMHDAEVAARTGRTVNAIRNQRERLGIANPAPGQHGKGPPWSASEDELLRSLTPVEAAAKTRRTLRAVYGRRHALGLGNRR